MVFINDFLRILHIQTLHLASIFLARSMNASFLSVSEALLKFSMNFSVSSNGFLERYTEENINLIGQIHRINLSSIKEQKAYLILKDPLCNVSL